MKRNTIAAALIALVATAVPTSAAPVTFTKLTGLTGGTLANTAVWKADLTSVGIAMLQSISIVDGDNAQGAFGQFSGFDLDAIVLSTTDCGTAGCAAALGGLPLFNFGAGTVFVPGYQMGTPDPKLFGTGPAGSTVDNAVATLGAFDGESTTFIPPATGFLSMGFGGRLSFNLTGPVSTSSLFMYIGEVGDNGEVAAGRITVSDTPVDPVPEPASMLLFGTGLAGLLARRRAKK
jgi:hypothetical protein